MENTYKDYDETFILFEQVLLNYLPFASDTDKIMVNNEDSKLFDGLKLGYDISKAEIQSNWNEEARLADSFMFWLNTGLIFTLNGKYYINSEKLINRSLEYKTFKENSKTYQKVKK